MNFLILFVLIHPCSGTVFSSSSTTFKKYDAIFNFGDSISDTGNFLRSGAIAFPVIGKLPYGMTFFHHPTGRCSDGRLIVDFLGTYPTLVRSFTLLCLLLLRTTLLLSYIYIKRRNYGTVLILVCVQILVMINIVKSFQASTFGLPYLPPYLALGEGSRNFKHGVNFAVTGATALDPEFFYQWKIESILWTNNSLSVQLDWFRRFKSFLCRATIPADCDSYLKNSLFLVGEIGGNDYNYAFFSGGIIQQVEALVPMVVEAIIKASIALIEQGAVELVVPGNFPLGCSAAYLTIFQSANEMDYDSNGCLKAFNHFSEFHNEQLKLALETLRQKYTNAKIIYADYYGATMQFVQSPLQYGFHEETLYKVCCGGGGPYNFNKSASCGHSGSTVCQDPSSYANWDGIHLTEAAYRIIAMGLVRGPFTSPPLTSSPLKDALR